MRRPSSFTGAQYALFLVGLFVVGVGLVHGITDTAPPVVQSFEFVVIATLGLSIVVSGYLIGDRLDPARHSYAVYGTVAFASLTGGISLLTSGIQVLQGYTLNEPVYYSVVMAAGGAAAGPSLGYVYAKLQRRTTQATRRGDELASVNKRLAVTNRVLRHNLRNNLTVIAGISDDLQQRLESDAAEARLSLLTKRTDKLVQLSDKMGDIRSVWQSTERTTVDLVPVVHDLLDDVESEYPAVTVRRRMPDAAPVEAHPKIAHAIEEVVENAIEHNDAATLTIDVTVRLRDDRVVFEVSDSGCGLPDIERELFSEVDPSESPLEHGVGLGLWLVYWTVEQSRGDLSVTNNEGAVVQFDLPRAETDDAPVGPATAVDTSPGATA